MNTVLVANRGEIALRVFRTARALGLRTAAIYTDLDVAAPHVRVADVAVPVSSYLNIDAVVAAARSVAADVVHPGYGFLSERSAFARALDAAGVALAGPSADVMDAMGRKDAAREIAVAAGVPVVPSYDINADPSSFAYPVLVKAAAGGGGKGMRIVRSAGDFDEAVAAAQREATSSFGDDAMLIERYVERGRHIEVQILADRHGNVLHLWERDCSTQRRHQKVLEEAPAPTIGDETRRRLTQAAVDLAREVGYVGAGTVEFLLDVATGDFYFLEMNTRLQVEHPVTEAITGVDLVELQLKIAAGDRLTLRQEDIQRNGWAVEARVYAEDSFGGFLPQAGTATEVRWPTNVRVDHALESGQVVSTSYDPMLGKIIAHGATREEARAALVAALDGTAILGLTTNTGFLRTLVASDEFRDATIDTAWLDRHEIPAPDAAPARESAAWEVFLARREDAGPFHSDGFRLAGDPAPVVIDLDEPVTLSGPAPRDRPVADVGSDHVEVVHHSQRFVFTRPDVFGDDAVDLGSGAIAAPMPGTVLNVRVAVGDEVVEGQVLGSLEAMKMELSLTSSAAGTVRTVGAVEGVQVALGAILFEIEYLTDDHA